MEPVIRFFKAYPDAVSAIRADMTALGTIPSAALRYCEAVRTASSFGWYAFPARSINLLFDGTDTYMEHESGWERLDSEHAADPDQWWNHYCPEHLNDMAPPLVTSIGQPGYVQIWSGLLVQTRKDWSSLIRPIANTSQSGQYFCFEGIVETDRYGPAPLFINMRLLTTNVPISIDANEPLFQVQPVHRCCYDTDTLNDFQLVEPVDMSDDDWSGYRKTVRSVDPAINDHQQGQYAVQTRKRAKQKTVAL